MVVILRISFVFCVSNKIIFQQDVNMVAERASNMTLSGRKPMVNENVCLFTIRVCASKSIVPVVFYISAAN